MADGTDDDLRAGIEQLIWTHTNAKTMNLDRIMAALLPLFAARAAVESPAEPSKHKHDPGWCEFGGGWACQRCLDEQRAAVDLPAESFDHAWNTSERTHVCVLHVDHDGPCVDARGAVRLQRSAVESPAQPLATHAFRPAMSTIPMGAGSHPRSALCGECALRANDPTHQRGADTPQPDPAEITNRWLENHLYVDPAYVGAWCEHITHVTLDGYGSARCNKRPSEHVSAVPYTTEIAQSAVRGADVPTTEPAAEGALAQCWDCDLHLPKAEMRRIDTTSGWQWQCAACQPSAGASPTEPADVATEPAVGLERGVDAATQLAAGGSATQNPAEPPRLFITAAPCGCVVNLPTGFSAWCPHGTYLRTPGSPLSPPISGTPPTTPEDRHEFKPYRKRCVHGLDVGQECGLKADDPIHQATPEETAPAATCTHGARAVTADGRLWACSYCGVTGTDEPSAGMA